MSPRYGCSRCRRVGADGSDLGEAKGTSRKEDETMVSRRRLLAIALAGPAALTASACTVDSLSHQASQCVFVDAGDQVGRENAAGITRVCSPSRLRPSAVDQYYATTEDGRFVPR